MLAGGSMVFIWKLRLSPWAACLASTSCAGVPGLRLFIVGVSLATANPSAEIEAEFEQARTYQED